MSGNIVINTFPISANITEGGARRIIEADLARIAHFKELRNPHGPQRNKDVVQAQVLHKKPFASKEAPSVDVTDAAVTYTIQVGVGSPATNYTLLIDTGSSNTWVGADKAYKKTKTSQDTGKTIKVSYGSGSFNGEQYTDQVSLGKGLVIKQQGLGVSKSAQGFNDVDGILGIGPADLTQGTVEGGEEVPTVTNNLFKQGTIPTNAIGISYIPTTDNSGATNGELTFGGTDSSKIKGDVTYAPITQTSPASQYWGIDQSITYGSNTMILDNRAGIVDTGTTLLYLASDAFSAYKDATGGEEDKATGLLKITEDQYDALQSLYFTINGVKFEFTKNAQVWPRAMNSKLGGDADAIYLVAADNGSQSGQGLDFINGFAWLQRFYTVYDTTNKQVGVANTPHTFDVTN